MEANLLSIKLAYLTLRNLLCLAANKAGGTTIVLCFSQAARPAVCLPIRLASF